MSACTMHAINTEEHMAKAAIIGTGLYAPGQPIDNETLKKLTGVEFDSQRHEEKLGIKSRHIARLSGLKETTADFAEHAARDALQAAKVDPKDVGFSLSPLIRPNTFRPQHPFSCRGGCRVENQALNHSMSVLPAQVFIEALDAAARHLITDSSMRYALVVGVYNMPAYIRDGDAFGWSILPMEPCGGARAPGAGPVGIHRWRLRDRWARSGTLSASMRRNKIAPLRARA